MSCLCPSQCTCDYHGRNDGLGSGMLLSLLLSVRIRRKRTQTRWLCFESSWLLRNQRGGLTQMALMWCVNPGCLYCFHFDQFNSFKAPQIVWNSQTQCVTKIFIALVFTQWTWQRRSNHWNLCGQVQPVYRKQSGQVWSDVCDMPRSFASGFSLSFEDYLCQLNRL